MRGLEDHDAGRLIGDCIASRFIGRGCGLGGALDLVEELADGRAEHCCEPLNFRQGQISALVELEGQARAAHTSAGSKLRLRDAQLTGHALDYGCDRHLMVPFYICRPMTTI
nr:MAG TPA: hypothetical protein [Caudoviricetes sp.]